MEHNRIKMMVDEIELTWDVMSWNNYVQFTEAFWTALYLFC